MSRNRPRRRKYKRFNGCREKARYGSREEAQADQPAQLPYPCPWCGCWHLTSSEYIAPRKATA